MRWWGWGRDGRDGPLPEEARAALFSLLGAEDRPPRPVGDAPQPPPPVPLSPPLRSSVDPHERLVHSTGKSSHDLLLLRLARLPHAPDAVLFPGSAAEVAEALAWAAREDVAVIPFGGGTSVVGGVDARRGGHRAAVSLDLGGLSSVGEVDEESGLVEAQCGVLGPDLEARLNARGWSVGHFPQSFEHSTLGGWVATRSAGQNSTRWGKIEHMVAGLRAVTPGGEWTVPALPARASGPELRELLVGSEGQLGVLTDVTLRVHRLPGAMRFSSWFFPCFASGRAALREMMQAGLRPAVLRLSDELETRLHLTLSGADRKLGPRLLRAFGAGSRLDGCHLMAGFEGAGPAGDRVARGEQGHASRIARAGGGFPVGSSPGRHWERERFAHPYLRDRLLDVGVLAETFETATTYARIPALVEAVREALEAPLVMCHLSHAYPDGASLYFTWFADAPDPEQALELWTRTKRAAGEVLAAHGAALSHHHAVGHDHRPFMAVEHGERGMALLRAAKRELDPTGILNPEKLL
ncbi:MAG: FAD-binding oxidoreductase [Planctomycetota bacterium]|jgi:alkyldihydroxyacetonephosphate synthase|nr:FAD-binding oxidoreductase [Planctomycetota bacterium]MDP6763616.1 FAD-binding oxidoreductase [Planctomycetota bacterium]MDP6989723.1 FAD-binding oxidoreductase [Planctomycetota bacterium]